LSFFNHIGINKAGAFENGIGLDIGGTLRFMGIKEMAGEIELEELLTRFEEFQCQETFHDADIHTVYLRAFDYYIATHEKVQHDKGVSFANFVAGYLKSEQDAGRDGFI
jgi:hypothetical protein